MTTEIILSILTPAVPSRLSTAGGFCTCDSYLHNEDCANRQGVIPLCAKLAGQIGNKPVEHLVFVDNKRRTVGEKRDALLRIAKGRYVAFVDDDDDVTEDYVASILEAAASNPDVITFEQEATVNGEVGIVEFGLGNPNQAFVGLPAERPNANPHRARTKRNAWHICAWRRTLAILSHFPAKNYSEDWAFAKPLCELPGLKEVHIPKVLHYYRHSRATTEAPPP